MSQTSQNSKYETLGASVDTKIVMLTWTNQIKTHVNIHRPHQNYTEELYFSEEPVTTEELYFSEELPTDEQLRRSELHLDPRIKCHATNSSIIY
jgi:hypothetical protein